MQILGTQICCAALDFNNEPGVVVRVELNRRPPYFFLPAFFLPAFFLPPFLLPFLPAFFFFFFPCFGIIPFPFDIVLLLPP